MSERRVMAYNANGWLTTQENYNSANTKIVTLRYDYADSYDATGNTLKYTLTSHQGAGYTNTYTTSYEKWGGYKEKTVTGSSSYFQSGNSTTTYDVNGNITKVQDPNNASLYRTFISHTQGPILQKQQDGQTQYYYYANGNPVGSTGTLAGNDFDYNYTPVSDRYPATTPSSYTVNGGDTLQGIALAVYGDAKLWYLIADANGIKTDADLKAGQTLKVPNTVSNIYNDYGTFKVYNPGQVIGDTTPSLPDPPPPPVQGSSGGGGRCGGLAQILVIIVTIVVGDYVRGLNLAASAWANAGIGAAAGSLAGQAVGVATGLQDGINWKSVATAGLTAGLTQSIKFAPDLGHEILNDAATGAFRNFIGQGVSIVVGQQEKFSWSGLAAAAIAAPIIKVIDDSEYFKSSDNNRYNYDAVLPTAGREFTWGNFGSSLAGEFLKATTRASATILVNKGGQLDWGSVATNAFGDAIGNSIVQHRQWVADAPMREAGQALTGFGGAAVSPVVVGGIDQLNAGAASGINAIRNYLSMADGLVTSAGMGVYRDASFADTARQAVFGGIYADKSTNKPALSDAAPDQPPPVQYNSTQAWFYETSTNAYREGDNPANKWYESLIFKALSVASTPVAIFEKYIGKPIQDSFSAASQHVSRGNWYLGKDNQLAAIEYLNAIQFGAQGALEVGVFLPPTTVIGATTRSGSVVANSSIAGPIIVTPRGVAVTPEVLSAQGTSQLVGDFRGLQGATVDEIVSRVPGNWTLAEQERGLGIRFIDELGAERVRLHAPGAGAPAGTNSASGWSLRVHVPGTKNSYYDNFGNIVGPKANEGHIPIYGNPKARP